MGKTDKAQERFISLLNNLNGLERVISNKIQFLTGNDLKNHDYLHMNIKRLRSFVIYQNERICRLEWRDSCLAGHNASLSSLFVSEEDNVNVGCWNSKKNCFKNKEDSSSYFIYTDSMSKSSLTSTDEENTTVKGKKSKLC